jgi:nucleotidyltransferase/DNA polymerase involved in DNA repair
VARWVLHVDLDQFIAAVEVLRHPELRGRPVVVGGDGDPTKRGVVSTASYEAREHGVHSGLPLRTAAKRLPDAVFLPVDRAAYEEISETVMEVLRSTGAVVEVLGWDEAFVGVDTEDPEAFGRSLARQVRETTQLDCTVGIGENKLQAKIATGFGKPAGVFRLTFANWFEVLGARPTEALWGIGAKTAKKLAGLGIGTVSDLATADPDALAAVFGPMTGPWLVLLASGRGDAEVDDSPYVARGHGREETFQRNIADWSQVEAEVTRIAGLLALDLASEPRPALRIVVKVRYAPFITETHGVTLAEPSSDPAVIVQAAAEALSRFTGRRPVRLLGVRAQFEKGARLDGAGYTGRSMPISPRAGLEGSGWRSAVTVNPQRSYSRRARELVSVTHRWTVLAPCCLAQPATASMTASPTPRPRACGRMNMPTSSTTSGAARYPPPRPAGQTSGRNAMNEPSRLARWRHSSSPKAASLAWVEAKASGASSSACRRISRSACQSVVVVARTRTMPHRPFGRVRRSTFFPASRLSRRCRPCSASAPVSA